MPQLEENIEHLRCYFSYDPKIFKQIAYNFNLRNFSDSFRDDDKFSGIQQDVWTKIRKENLFTGEFEERASKKTRLSGRNHHSTFKENEADVNINMLPEIAKVDFQRIELIRSEIVSVYLDKCKVFDSWFYYVGELRFTYYSNTSINSLYSALESLYPTANHIMNELQVIYPARSKVTEVLFHNNIKAYLSLEKQNIIADRKCFQGYYVNNDDSDEVITSEQQFTILRAFLSLQKVKSSKSKTIDNITEFLFDE